MHVWPELLRRAYLLALTGLLAWSPPGPAVAQNTGGDPSTDSARGQRWAVLVGVNRYAQLGKLTYCVADATKLRDQLVAAGFPREQVFLLVDGAGEAADLPFRENIQRRIESVLKVARPDDLVLVAFSGHGVHLDGKSYFCPTDANLESPETTMVPLGFIYRQLEGSQARQKLLVVDACRNDPRPPGSRDATSHKKSLEGLGEQLKAVPAGILALSSSAAGQISWEDEKLGHGVFAYHVMEGLAGKADETGNRDGVVSLLELYNYAYLQTTRWVLRNRPGYLQTPELLGKITGDFELGRKLAPPLAVAPFDAVVAKSHQQAWSRYLGQPLDLTNSLGMKLTLIPPGEFLMGSPESEAERSDESQHRVRITQPFYLGIHEVTVGQFRGFVEARSYRTEAERDGLGGFGLGSDGKGSQKPEYSWKNCGFTQGDDHPVVNVSWNDAVAFCEWLRGKEGNPYRLPTEAEWEYACRAGTRTPFHFGSELNGRDGNCNGNSPYGTTAEGPYLRRTAKVGSYEGNVFGLHDMHGNVDEWCSDWYGGEYYNDSPTDDPTGPTAGSARVLRGGSWLFAAVECRSATRLYGTPGFVLFGRGFRVASSSADASGR